MPTVVLLIVVGEVFLDAGLTLAGLWLLAGLVYLLFNGPLRARFAGRRIQARPRDAAMLRHEILFSALNILGSALAGLGTSALISSGIAGVDLDPRRWPIGLAQFAAYFVLFDLYFYSIHRLLHTPFLYRVVHRHHHRSPVPGPLTAFSFHPIEGIVSNYFVTFMMLAVDVNIVGLVLIYAYGILNSVLIHSGFEVFPRGWYGSRLTRWYLTPTFHDLHHSREDGNYGGFMTIWDRALGTLCPPFRPVAAGEPETTGGIG